jgi:hypothetical protein
MLYGKIVLEKSLTVHLHSIDLLSVSFALTRSGVGVVPHQPIFICANLKLRWVRDER